MIERNPIFEAVDAFFSGQAYRDPDSMNGDTPVAARIRNSDRVSAEDGSEWQLLDILVSTEHDGQLVTGRQITLGKFNDSGALFFELAAGSQNIAITPQVDHYIVNPDEFMVGLQLVIGQIAEI